MFLQIIGEVKDKGTVCCTSVIDTVLTMFPTQSPVVFEKVFHKILGLILGEKVIFEKTHSQQLGI